MRGLVAFVKTSIVGGVLFLLPVLIALVLLGHALDALRPAVARFTGVGGVHVGGIALATLATVLGLLGLCFLAGLVARTGAGAAARRWLEESLLGRLPMYQMLKAATADLAGLVGTGEVEVALREAEGGWQIAFVMERFADGWCTLLVPEAPSATSGTIVYVRTATLRRLDVSVAQAMKIVKHGGLGSAEALASAFSADPGALTSR